jgi:ribokinase
METAGLSIEGIYRGNNVKSNITAVLSVGFDRGFASWFPTWRTVEVDELFHKHVRNCTHVHFSLKDCLEGDFLDVAKARGCTVSIDATWDDRFTLSTVEKYLRKCDIFFCNNLESSLITNAASIEGIVDILKDVSDFFVLKLGAEGSVLYKSGMCLAVPAPHIERVYDTTGAGDAFVAGFLYGYLNGRPFEECLKFGSASGTLTTTFYGGSDEKYTLEKVIELEETLEVTQLY